jgi:hypothetical protein
MKGPSEGSEIDFKLMNPRALRNSNSLAHSSQVKGAPLDQQLDGRRVDAGEFDEDMIRPSGFTDVG